MSKKNLARTAIEGGRNGYSKWERRNSHNEERNSEREFCKRAELDPDSSDDYDIVEKSPVSKGFTDKLGPMFRWLHRQVGRAWNDVYSEVTQNFDTRTTAGRHIVHDHLLRSVEITPDVYRYKYYRGTGDDTTSYSKDDFYVNSDGILCSRTYISRKFNRVPKFNVAQIANWLSGRVVGKVGKKLFWFIPIGKGKKHRGPHGDHQWKTQWGYFGRTYYSNYGLHYLFLTKEPIYKYEGGLKVYENDKPIVLDYKTSWSKGTPTFRQDRKLNEKELSFWNTIPAYYQTQVLEVSPTWDGPPKKDRYFY